MLPPKNPLNDPRTDPLLAAIPERDGYKLVDRRYLLYDTLGRGGMGVVYKGRHVELGSDVAIKCLDPTAARRNPDFVARFRKEARAAAALNHRNVVRVIDVFESCGLHFLVMDLIDGEDARKRLARERQITVDEALRIALGAANGLAAAHRAGLVHRDVKPDNVLIGSRGTVKLADLGLAKSALGDSTLTASGEALGTPRYMPPEQFEDARSVSTAADVYSLGATIYFLLAGHDGVRSGSLAEVVDHARHHPFPDPGDTRPDVPAELSQLVASCTSKDPRDRPQDASEVAYALRRLVAGSRAPVPLEIVFDEGIAAATLDGQPLNVEGKRVFGLLEPPRGPEVWSAALELEDSFGYTGEFELEWALNDRSRAPRGFRVSQAEPSANEPAQSSGPAAEAGWAWKVRHDATGVEFILVEPGTFDFGGASEVGQSRRGAFLSRNWPIREPFYLAVTELSWSQATGRLSRPASNANDPEGSLPVANVKRSVLTGAVRRLGWLFPTEEQWEYACRAGTTTRFSSGDSVDALTAFAWCRNRSKEGASPPDPFVGAPSKVGKKGPNPWGFYDMHGNVAEWCTTQRKPSLNPEIVRGGSFADYAADCRSASRRDPDGTRGETLGLRPLVALPRNWRGNDK